MSDKSGRAIFIAGPTASGKSAAAIALAEAIGGEIVNADAIQVYRDLDILSGRPTAADEARAPHHLFGFVDGGERYSAGRFGRDAARVISEIGARGATAIVAGGTGLYFRALHPGLAAIPSIPDAVRAEARVRLESLGPKAFRGELIARDEGAATISETDPQRLLRAFEVLAATGVPLSEWRRLAGSTPTAAPSARVVIEPDRAFLYAASDARLDRMIARSALDEARRLMARELDPDLPVMKALGAAELMAHLDRRLSAEAAIDLAKRNTRRFAKRQLTWFRHQAADWPRVDDWRRAVALLVGGLHSAR